MASTSTNSTADLLTHHLTAFGNNDLEAILQDYKEESQVLTPEGPRQGLAAIRTLFAGLFALIPRGCTFALQQRTVIDDTAYIVWTSDSAVATVSLGTDSFFLKDGKIHLQTFAMLMERK